MIRAKRVGPHLFKWYGTPVVSNIWSRLAPYAAGEEKRFWTTQLLSGCPILSHQTIEDVLCVYGVYEL